MAKQVYQLNREFHFTIYGACGMEKLCSMIESLWDVLSFFKLIYGQKFINDEDSRERMILEHESYLGSPEAERRRNAVPAVVREPGQTVQRHPL